MGNFSYTNVSDKALVPVHGRRLGLTGDAYGSDTSLLVLDGVSVGSTRSGPAPLIVSAAGHNGAGAVTVAGAKVGDNVAIVVGPSNADASASFESTVTVAGQVQQSSASDLSGNQYLFFVQPQS